MQNADISTVRTEIQDPESQRRTTNAFYLATWRWHFYAGVYVVAFLIILALTGLVMLYQPQLEARAEDLYAVGLELR